MTLYRCNRADDPRCPYAQGGIVCPHWGKHNKMRTGFGDQCGVWERCVTKDDEEFSVRCCRVKEEG